MAQTRIIEGDLGSSVVQELVKSYNNLIDQVEAAADFDALKTAIADGSLGINKIEIHPGSNLPEGQLVD